MRIIWAIDAIGESALLLERAAEFLRHLAARTAIEIEPVSVLEGVRAEAGLEDRLLTDEQALPGLERSLQALTAEFDDLSAHFLSPRVLGGSSFPAARRLARHAAARSAQLVVCSTHARSGIPRLMLGSFTEDLLRASDVPVAVVRVRPVPEPRHAAYWTGFGEGDSLRFRQVVNECRRLGSGLSLFHCPERLIEPLIQGGTYLFSGAQPVLHRLTSPELYRIERRGLAWARWAEHQGVTCEFFMDERPGSFTAHFIELLEKQKSGIAFMAWETGASGRNSGPRVREVLRKAPCPVWVLR